MLLHKLINYRSWRKGLINQASMNHTTKEFHIGGFTRLSSLEGSKHPANTYGVYYPHVYGKRHSIYPRF